MRTWTRSAAVIGVVAVGALSMTGCASTKLSNLQKGTPVVNIYKNGVDGVGQDPDGVNRKLLADLRSNQSNETRELPRYEAWSRSSLNEIRQLFPRVENPTITVYVYPHLATEENVPVPGYTTAFNLYTRDQYALPGELPANYPNGAYRRTAGFGTIPVPQPKAVQSDVPNPSRGK